MNTNNNNNYYTSSQPANPNYYVNHGFANNNNRMDEKPENPNVIIPNVPTILQPANTGPKQIKPCKDYLLSLPGVMRILLIVLRIFLFLYYIYIIFAFLYFKVRKKIFFSINKLFQTAGWIAIAAVPKIYNAQIFLPPEFAATRDAYLFFSIVGFLLSIFIFLLFFLNIVSLGYLNKLPWAAIV